MLLHGYYAHYYINGIEHKMWFTTPQEAYLFLEEGHSTGTLFIYGVIYPDGSEVLNPYVDDSKENVKRWMALVQESSSGGEA